MASVRTSPCVTCERIMPRRYRQGRCSSCYERLRLRGIDAPPTWFKGPARELVKLDNGCLILTGKASNGYMHVKDQDGRSMLAHRLAWIEEHGIIPDGMTVDHVCHNEALDRGECNPGVCEHRRCVNVDHLRLLPWGGAEGHAALGRVKDAKGRWTSV